uniref:Uncharacterized protein n=1 Tax=Anguilla anguilla TaxID=7936 RepID=A0A0E9TYT9_ANGAN
MRWNIVLVSIKGGTSSFRK